MYCTLICKQTACSGFEPLRQTLDLARQAPFPSPFSPPKPSITPNPSLPSPSPVSMVNNASLLVLQLISFLSIFDRLVRKPMQSSVQSVWSYVVKQIFFCFFSLSLSFLRRIFSLITFSLSVLVYMSIIENVKKQNKNKDKKTTQFAI